MGSYVQTVSTAVDNRLAVTDDAFGLSSSGSGNVNALNGHVFQIGTANGDRNSGGSRPYAANSGSSSGDSGGGMTFNLLDNDAIGKAFEFAENSLSSVLENLISGQKVNAASAADSATKLANAIASQAATQSESIAESNKTLMQFLTDNMQKIAIGGVVLGLGYYYFKGRRT